MPARKKVIESAPIPTIYKRYQLFLYDGRTVIIRTTHERAKEMADLLYSSQNGVISCSKDDGRLYCFRTIMGIVEVEDETAPVQTREV